jgi:hypothetical protein
MSTNRVRNALVTAAIATGVTSVTALLLSKVLTGRAAAGLNATSHIVWGDSAGRVKAPDFKHTAVGAALNAGAMASWAAVHELLPRARSPLAALSKGALVSALAYLTDYYVVPKRLTPGFEKHFTPGGMLLMYGALAGALGAGEALAAAEDSARYTLRRKPLPEPASG